MADLDRELGKLDERTQSHADRFDHLDRRISTMETKLDHVVSVLDRAGGSWKALVAAGSIAAALTAAAGWIIDHIGFRP